jgi:hypothetical protein
MNIKERIFTKLSFASQSRLKNSYNEFHANPTNCSVADVRSQINGSTDRQSDGHSLHIQRSFLTSQRTPKTDFSICTVVNTVHKTKHNVEFRHFTF